VLLPVFLLGPKGGDDDDSFEELCKTLRPSLQRCLCEDDDTIDEPYGTDFIEQYQAMRTLLTTEGALNLSSAETIKSCSPQNTALVWLTEEESLPTPVTSNNSTSHLVQRYLLATMFVQLSGLFWDNFHRWMTEVDVCRWVGVTCSQKGMVTELDLQKNNLVGTLPQEISRLSLLSKWE